jgi:hypothetical protein
MGWTCGYGSEDKLCVHNVGGEISWKAFPIVKSTRIKVDGIRWGWCAVANFGIDDIELPGPANTLWLIDEAPATEELHSPVWSKLCRAVILVIFFFYFWGRREPRLSHFSLLGRLYSNPCFRSLFISRGAPHQTAWETSVSERINYGREMAGQI